MSSKKTLAAAAAIALLLGACGGGETAIVGVGNHSNQIGVQALLRQVADELAENAATPRVSDELLLQVFGALAERARSGDAEAALIILLVANEQREEEAD